VATVPHESISAYFDRVHAPIPFPDEARARTRPRGQFARLSFAGRIGCCDLVHPSNEGGFQPAKSLYLQGVGAGPFKKPAANALRCRVTEEFSPLREQSFAIQGGNRAHSAFDLSGLVLGRELLAHRSLLFE
jgi:hypothetical protein